MKNTLYFLGVLLITGVLSNNAKATEYTSTGGNASDLLSWKDGGGMSPASFMGSGDVFIIPAGVTMTTGSPWSVVSVTIKGELVVDYLNPVTIATNSVFLIDGGIVTTNDAVFINEGSKFTIVNKGKYIHNNVVDSRNSIYAGEENFQDGSTVEIKNWRNTDISLISALSVSGTPVERDGKLISSGHYYPNLTLDLPSNFSGDWYQKIPPSRCFRIGGGGFGGGGADCNVPLPVEFTFNKLHIKSLGGAIFLPHTMGLPYRSSSPIGPPATILDFHRTKGYLYDFFRVGSFELENGTVDLNKGMLADIRFLETPGLGENIGMTWVVKDGYFKVGLGGTIIATEGRGVSPLEGIIGVIVVRGNKDQPIAISCKGQLIHTGLICINEKDNKRIINDSKNLMTVKVDDFFTLENGNPATFSYLQFENANVFVDNGLKGNGWLVLVGSNLFFEKPGIAQIFDGPLLHYFSCFMEFISTSPQSTGNVLKGSMNVGIFSTTPKLVFDNSVTVYGSVFINANSEFFLNNNTLTVDPRYDKKANLVLFGSGGLANSGFVTMGPNGRLSLPVRSDKPTIFPMKQNGDPFFVGIQVVDTADHRNFTCGIKDLTIPIKDKDFAIQKQYYIEDDPAGPANPFEFKIHFGYSTNAMGPKFSQVGPFEIRFEDAGMVDLGTGNSSTVLSPLSNAVSTSVSGGVYFKLDCIIASQGAFSFAPLLGMEDAKVVKTGFYPNPVTDKDFMFSYNLKETTDVKIEIYNQLTGEKVLNVEDNNHSKGEYKKAISAAHLPTGHYTCKVLLIEGGVPKVLTEHLFVR